MKCKQHFPIFKAACPETRDSQIPCCGHCSWVVTDMSDSFGPKPKLIIKT